MPQEEITMSMEKRFCKNCNAELFGDFCSSCGQCDKDIHIPVKELAVEVLDLIPSFDKRLFRSIKPLLFKPGFLTLEYLSGKRKQYISPFKLYFFISFIFFLLGSLTDTKKDLQTAKDAIAADSLRITSKEDSAFVSVVSGDSNLRFTVGDSTKAESIFGPKAIGALRKMKSNPQLLFDKIKEHRPKIIFLLLPIFALLLKMLYIRYDALYIKHLVFAFYFHSFLFFIFLLVHLIELPSISIIRDYSDAMYLTIPVYLYYGLQRVYPQPKWKTIIKLFFLIVTYGITFLIAILSASAIIITVFYL